MELTVTKTKFKAEALGIFRDVEATGESVIVTDHGKPKIIVKPYIPKNINPIDELKGCVVEYIDPFEPVCLGDWDGLK